MATGGWLFGLHFCLQNGMTHGFEPQSHSLTHFNFQALLYCEHFT